MSVIRSGFKRIYMICLMSGSSGSRLLNKGNCELNMRVRHAGAVTRSTGSQKPNKASRTGPVTLTRFCLEP